MPTIGTLRAYVEADTGQFVAQIQKAELTMRGMAAAHNDLKDRFQERFTYVGLMEVSAALGATKVLGRETYPLVTTLTAAVTMLGESFSFLAGPAGLVISALVAVGAVVWGLEEKQKSHLQILKQVIDQNDKNLKSYDDQITKIGDYKTAFGTLTPAIAEYRSALEEARTVTLADQRRQLVEDQKAISESIIQTMRTHLNFASVAAGSALLVQEAWGRLDKAVRSSPSLWAEAARTGEAAFSRLKSAVAGALSLVAAATPGFKGLQEALAGMSKPVDAKALGDLGVQFARLGLQVEDIDKRSGKTFEDLLKGSQSATEAARRHADALASVGKGFTQLGDLTRKYNDEAVVAAATGSQKISLSYRSSFDQQVTEINRAYNATIARLDKSGLGYQQYSAKVVQLDAARNAAIEAADRASYAKMQAELAKSLTASQEVYKKAFGSISTTFSSDFATMIADGRSWADSFKTFFQDVEKTFIEDVTQMMIKWAAFEALTGLFGMNPITATALTGFAPRAAGGPVSASMPYLVGEQGPELFVPASPGTIVPSSALSSVGAAPQSIQLGMQVPVVIHAEHLDPNALANDLAELVARRAQSAVQLALRLNTLAGQKAGLAS